jgi:SAM-dependent methyltransferase
MPRFQITLVRPQDYLHSEVFREVAETLQFGLRSLGHAAQIQENLFDAGATNIFLGAHLLTPQQAGIVPPGSVLYNLEQLGGPALPQTYYDLARQHQVWDYSLENIEKWKALHCAFPAVHVPLGYVPELTRIQPAPVEDIDVLFYGSLNPRRTEILNALKKTGMAVHWLFGIYGQQRDQLISRSKIILNIHFYEAKVFEIVRVSYLLANSKAVISETSQQGAADKGLGDAILQLPYDSLVAGCVSLLKDDGRRKQLERSGFAYFSQRSEPEILSRALMQESRGACLPNAQSSIPRKLNMGSGKDWRADHFNVDINGYWEPDAVLDFNQALPVGQIVETPRWGKVTLEDNYFEEIIANDCLEHIPNLMKAMTSCLNLLRIGGVFRISVPYDLSWGAWQDPTHVRAFNERSWLYYTDWFWYMGWTEARFDLVQFELGLSSIGEAMKTQMKGEDLVRVPRAVDQLKVVLRKRWLTDAEKQQVSRYLQRPERTSEVTIVSGAPAPLAETLKPAPAAAQVQVTQIGGSSDSPLLAYLQAAFNQAMAGVGKIDPGVLEMDGMSGRKYRLLINNLIASMPNARYLEIGTWAGSTLCSAVNGNSVKATAIDNWSEFGGPKAQFLSNLARFKTANAEVSFVEKDFRTVDYSSLGRFNVYMFDGPHTAKDQFDGIALVLSALEDEFILIVDDWNHTPARQGTLTALHDLNLSVLHSFEIRTTLDGSHPALARQASDWHNGYFIAVLSKRKVRQALPAAELQPQAVTV